jgi:hypothetical protein
MDTLDELLDSIFDGKKPALYPEFEGWVRGSRRFRAFAATYRHKLRSKLKNARDEGGMQDLRAELETAELLLRAERFTLEYEKYAASKVRGPDFTVTFKTHTPFNVEVRRIRTLEMSDGDTPARTNKLMTVLCDKVGQMPPGIVNLLWLIAHGEISGDDLTRAVGTLRQLAERKTEEYFTRRGFESAAHFVRQYGRLSGIVLRPAGADVLWLNPLARHAAPPEIVTTLRRLLTS